MLISFVLAAIATFIVFDVLARMTAEDPREGSFRSYAKKAYGRWAGFSSGWMYWCSEVLIMGSQMTALAIFSRFWFPGIPMWIFAAGYAVLGLLVIWIGNKGFDRLENVLAVIKVAAIVMFLVIAASALMGWHTAEGACDGRRMVSDGRAGPVVLPHLCFLCVWRHRGNGGDGHPA